MTLTVFEDARGLWLREEGEDGIIPFERSSYELSVTDGYGNVLDGALLVNGKPFNVERGKCKLLTECLAAVGFGDVCFITEAGVKRPCAPIRRILAKGWYLPLPHETLDSGEIVALLRKAQSLREKLESAKALCTEAVSSVLGI